MAEFGKPAPRGTRNRFCGGGGGGGMSAGQVLGERSTGFSGGTGVGREKEDGWKRKLKEGGRGMG